MAPAAVSSTIATNRRARHDYHVLERFEAGIELRGTEVKSLRLGHVSLVGAFAQIDGGEIYLDGMTIEAYEFGNRFNHPKDRRRRLLLHKREILKLKAESEQKGHAIIPLRLYFKGRSVKVELGTCKGKKLHDKRETLKRQTADREAGRALADARKR
jgi:SsrA-binding protein